MPNSPSPLHEFPAAIKVDAAMTGKHPDISYLITKLSSKSDWCYNENLV